MLLALAIPWETLLAFESLILMLTLWKSWSMRDHYRHVPLLKLLLRDGGYCSIRLGLELLLRDLITGRCDILWVSRRSRIITAPNQSSDLSHVPASYACQVLLIYLLSTWDNSLPPQCLFCVPTNVGWKCKTRCVGWALPTAFNVPSICLTWSFCAALHEKWPRHFRRKYLYYDAFPHHHQSS